MDLVTPSIGLIFWTTLAFVVLLILLRKFAWKPILSAVNTREESITNAMNAAEEAKKEMANLTSTNERLLNEAREERDSLMKEAREMKVEIIAKAKEEATSEGEKMIVNAKAAIETERKSAIADLKNQVASLSIDIAEKIVKGNLSGDDKQKQLVNELVEEVNLN
ncbi:MAG: F-type H+-transporting ATPase subunit b [Flavobacteriales bacterium]|jgi:F-type H+-transporting ATPase subunit b|tara:strand:- start:25761 stop:26255 length:495 start_codon:yes stop_codon:yes gene_type:complete